MNKTARYKAFIKHFSEAMPNPTTELVYRTPFELMVAVILSAQCYDKRVNQVTPTLFEAFPTPAAMAQATEEEIFYHIRSISYPNNKAKYLLQGAQILVQRFGGRLPQTREDLQQLPGVGRKSANALLATLYGATVMPVDTHVARVSHRLGLVDQTCTTPYAIEKELVKRLPKQLISKAHHWLVLHGRYVCQARKPQCGGCPLNQSCLYFQNRAK